jgi:hypothetical protein
MNQIELKSTYPIIFEIIEEYYGVNERPKKILKDLILDRLGNKKTFKEKWSKGILKSIGKEIGYPTEELTLGYMPNYGGMVVFNKDLDNDTRNITQIQFYVSLLRNIYTIQITEIEEVMAYNPFLKKVVQNQTLKEIWVSPDHPIYSDLFLKIESYLDKTLVNPIYLPYSIQQIPIDEVEMHHTSNEANKVEDAFFRKILPLNKDFTILGNRNYRLHELS